MKKVDFVGECSGDGACFCWRVTEETYAQVVGDEAYKLELDYRSQEKESIESLADSGTYDTKTAEMLLLALGEWFLYPGEVFSEYGTRFEITTYGDDE